jgi:hypothetical protein
MNRSAAIAVITVGLAIYGVYIASYIPGFLVGTPMPLILIGFVAQACTAILGAVGVWRRSAWAPAVVVLLGVSVAATSIVEGFVLGIVSFDHALAVGLVALLITVGLAVFIKRPRSLAL